MLLDALGTLVRLVPPAPGLAAALGVEEPAAAAAFRAEVAYYLDHHLGGRDASSLAGLRDRCAAVFAESLAAQPGGTRVEHGVARSALLASLRFEAYPDAAPALERLAGRRLVVCSNWDCSLPDILAAVGLGGHVDAVVTSAGVGAAKPDPRIFAAALAAAGVAPDDAVHVGDSPDNDIAGARRAGIRALLLDRSRATLLDVAALISQR